MSQPSPLGTDHDIAAGQRLVRTLRRRPRLRAGLVQLAYVAGAVAAAILAAEIRAGPQVNAARTSNMLFRRRRRNSCHWSPWSSRCCF